MQSAKEARPYMDRSGKTEKETSPGSPAWTINMVVRKAGLEKTLIKDPVTRVIEEENGARAVITIMTGAEDRKKIIEETVIIKIARLAEIEAGITIKGVPTSPGQVKEIEITGIIILEMETGPSQETEAENTELVLKDMHTGPNSKKKVKTIRGTTQGVIKDRDPRIRSEHQALRKNQ
jgi:hypothetical protein